MDQRTAPPLSRAVGDIILGQYKKKRMSQKDISRATGIPEVTVRRKIAGESPITVVELVQICAAIGAIPQEVIDEAVEAIGGIDNLMSAATANVTPIAKHPQDMTADELDAYEGSKAAHVFDEEADQPDE